MFPNANITPNQTNTYPIKVIVTAELGSTKVTIWQGRQQALFSKNRSARTKSMSEMVENLEELKNDIK